MYKQRYNNEYITTAITINIYNISLLKNNTSHSGRRRTRSLRHPEIHPPRPRRLGNNSGTDVPPDIIIVIIIIYNIGPTG